MLTESDAVTGGAYKPLGFLAAKRRTLTALTGDIQHEVRDAEKNLLATGQVTVAEVAEAVMRCRSSQYSSSPHHREAGTEVHVFRPNLSPRAGHRGSWYIKLYFRAGIIFISVH